MIDRKVCDRTSVDEVFEYDRKVVQGRRGYWSFQRSLRKAMGSFSRPLLRECREEAQTIPSWDQ